MVSLYWYVYKMQDAYLLCNRASYAVRWYLDSTLVSTHLFSNRAIRVKRGWYILYIINLTTFIYLWATVLGSYSI